MDIRYIKIGNGQRNLLVLPGLSLKPVSDYEKINAAKFAEFASDFTVYLFDYRHSPKEGYSIDDMADDVADAIRELKLKDSCLYGMSLGGAVALSLACRYPDYFRKMVLCSAAMKEKNNPRVEKWLSYALKKDYIGLIHHFTKDVYSEEYYGKSMDQMIMMYKDLTDENITDLIAYLKAVNDFDLSGEVHRLDFPVKMFASNRDNVLSYEQIKESADALSCEIYFYEGYSHALYEEAADLGGKIHDFFMEEKEG